MISPSIEIQQLILQQFAELGSPMLQADSLPSEPPGKSNTAGTEGIDVSPLVLLTTQPDYQVFRVGNTDDEEVRHSTV